jgi:hypothetical protein
MCLVKCERCEAGVGYLVDNGIVRGVLQHISNNALVRLRKPVLANKENDLAAAIGRSNGMSDGVSSCNIVSLVGCHSCRS